MKKRFFLSTVLLLLFHIATFAGNGQQYIIFIDGGSTGSRLHVFQYERSPLVPVIKDVFSDNVKPGLSSYADHPEQAGIALKKILDGAVSFLQKEGANLKTTEINVLSSGGMRLLPQEKQQSIYASVTHYIQGNYPFSIGEIKTTDGKMEGLYGWLDINYLLGNFQSNQPTVGSIDMGGASTQITFETSDHKNPDDEVVLTINNRRYRVFSKSFLKLGQDQARNTMMEYKDASACYPKNYVFNNVSVGDFNRNHCRAVYSDIINQHHVSEQIPSTQHQLFIAYSGIYFTYNFFNLNQYDEQLFTARVNQVCSSTWEELQKNYPKIDAKYLATYCANAVYHGTLLYDVYKINGAHLTVLNQVNQKDIDWTLGAALYKLTQY